MREGGSYRREVDGTLTRIDGAAASDTPAPAAKPKRVKAPDKPAIKERSDAS